MPRRNTARKRKLKAIGEADYCAGFFDVHKQWNNGFYCPKWSFTPDQVYCCGPKNARYCCSPEGKNVIHTSPRFVLASASASEEYTDGTTTIVGKSLAPESRFINCGLTTVAGLVVSTLVLLSLLMTAVCWLWPRYSSYRKRKKAVQKITDGLGLPRTLIANTNGMTLIYQLQPETSSLANSDSLHQPLFINSAALKPALGVTSAQQSPPHLHDEPPPYCDSAKSPLDKNMVGGTCNLNTFTLVPIFPSNTNTAGFGDSFPHRSTRTGQVSQTRSSSSSSSALCGGCQNYQQRQSSQFSI